LRDRQSGDAWIALRDRQSPPPGSRNFLESLDNVRILSRSLRQFTHLIDRHRWNARSPTGAVLQE